MTTEIDAPGTQKKQDDLEFKKTLTGILGVDDVTNGGLPAGRPTLVCGGAGCGKSLLGMEFLVRGASVFNEPGLFVSFEEKPKDIMINYSSLRFQLAELVESKKIEILYLPVVAGDFEETGPFDLEGLFVRLDHAIKKIGAKRIVLDTIETLFGGIQNQSILRAEISRLFSWLKEREMTAIVTGERGDSHLTRQGLEEYVSDCVILMDHRVIEQVSTRRLRIVKYRGSLHGTNEYPFLIDECGISLFPITSMGLVHEAPTERVSSGIKKLDEMLGGSGYFRGSTVLITGVAGAGKTSVAAHFVDCAFKRGERTLYFTFEESPKQLIRNMTSIGLDLQQGLDSGLLRIEATRASLYGLELHLLKIHRLVQEFKPCNVVLDPFTNFSSVGSSLEVQLMLTRLIDFLKTHLITTIMTSLVSSGSPTETSEVGVSAWIDTWILLKEIESSGERNRGLYVLKSRGMAHSNQIREFKISS
jgi:circadian clock protein KaiC